MVGFGGGATEVVQNRSTVWASASPRRRRAPYNDDPLLARILVRESLWVAYEHQACGGGGGGGGGAGGCGGGSGGAAREIPLESHTSHFDAASASDCSTEDAWVKV